MTTEEAIKLLINATYSEEWQGNEDLTEAQHMAIESLEKQMAKKPNTAGGYHYYCFKCPTCNEYVRICQDNSYCLNCGQKLDWSGI